jgi:hypothetical protein
MAFATEQAAGNIQSNAPGKWKHAARRFDAAFSALQDADESQWPSRAKTCDAAMWQLFEVPAPDLAALARKLEIAFAPETDLEGMLDANAARALILQDVRRLAGVN